jgi:hypothetical protein
MRHLGHGQPVRRKGCDAGEAVAPGYDRVPATLIFGDEVFAVRVQFFGCDCAPEPASKSAGRRDSNVSRAVRIADALQRRSREMRRNDARVAGCVEQTFGNGIKGVLDAITLGSLSAFPNGQATG